MRPFFLRASAISAALMFALWIPNGRTSARPVQAAPTTRFASEIERLSEPDGSFDTDNLISNEREYLEVIPALVSAGASGGAYIGVGPDQNFSYIARVRPAVAYIIDIRRDNLLLHLLFKALFARSRSRVEYLAALTGRAPPEDAGRRAGATGITLREIVAAIDQAKAVPDLVALRRQVEETIGAFGVPLAPADYNTIARFHQAFIDAGLGLQFHTFNRPPQLLYPTFRQLLLATDSAGHLWNFLASDDDFQFVRGLEARDAVIPVVGDVAGPRAMRGIAAAVAAKHEQVSAFYISNVENYVFRDGLFTAYAANVARLPRGPRTVIIRSIFSGGGQSVSVVQPMNEMVAKIARGAYRGYGDLVR
jgi:hypothetical protein